LGYRGSTVRRARARRGTGWPLGWGAGRAWARSGRAVVGVGGAGFVLLAIGADRDRALVHPGQQLDHRQQAGAVAQLPGDRPGVEVEPVDAGGLEFVDRVLGSLKCPLGAVNHVA
jgi:hypothetical protein